MKGKRIRYQQTGDFHFTYFALSDWLGTKRVETVPNGTCLSTYASLAYGDELTPSGTCPDATEHHYTGKERDTESGNDFFLARYYSSTAGRFISPDWASGAEAVPYAQFGDPQSLNLYGYVRDNPIGGVDANGHVDWNALLHAGKELAGSVVVKVSGGMGLKETVGEKGYQGGYQGSVGASGTIFGSLSTKGVSAGIDIKGGAEIEAGGKRLVSVGGTAEATPLKDGKLNVQMIEPGGKVWKTDKESGVGAFTNSKDTLTIGGEEGELEDGSVEAQINKSGFLHGLSDAWNALKSPSPASTPTATKPTSSSCNSQNSCN
jgi:RHS repeat-associated protein